MFVQGTTVRAFLATIACCAFAPSLALAYPDRPVTLIVGFAAGGQNDLAARVIADGLSEKLGGSVIVENRPGANGNIATEAIAHAAADGHTLMFVATSLIYNATLFPEFEVNPSQDLVGVARVAVYPLYLTSTPKTFASVEAIIQAAKADPGGIDYSISGFGTSTHIAAEFFAQKAGLELMVIPYKGGSEAVTSTGSGETTLHFGGTAVLPLIEAGKLDLIAVTSPARNPKFPDTPTIRETLDGFAFDSWNGVFAPKDVDPAILHQLNTAITEILADPKLKARLQKVDLIPAPMGLEEFNAFYRKEQADWGKVITEAAITTE